MPDRKLTDIELDKCAKEHQTGKLFSALDAFHNEERKPSLYDLVLIELDAKIDAQKKIIINQGVIIKAILKHLELKEKSKNEK